MQLSDVAIRRPVLTVMMSLTILVLGTLAYFRLGMDLYPDVSFPFVTITTGYPGASPREIEENVTRPIEDAVSGIAGIDRVYSRSREDSSQVSIQFLMKVPMGEAVQMVRDKLGIALNQLPTGAKPPVITQVDVGAQPVLVFSVTANSPELNQKELRELLDDRVRPRLEQLDGVASVRVLGGAEPEVSVELFRDRLTHLGMTPDSVLQKIRGEHLDLPAGRYISGATEVGVRVQGEFESVNELRDMVVATAANGSQVRLGDVALVKSGTKEIRSLVRTNGVEAIGVEIVKQVGANSARVARAARQMLPEFEKTHGITSYVLVDQSVPIEANSHEVWVAIYFGGAMAILVILLFLLDVRGTIISALALPTSVFGTLFAMYVLGYSLNQLTLLGLSLAIGLLIDDAVVVRESITRRLEAGESPHSAASAGTQEIALAVFATTLTLCAVFVPVGFMQGIVGQFFEQFGITITAAVLFSLFIAFTLDPMLSARFVQARDRQANRQAPALERILGRGFAAVDLWYGRSLGWVLAHGKVVAFVALALFTTSLLIARRLGSEFLPKEDRGDLIVNLEFPPGTSLAATAARSEVAEAAVRALPGVTTVYSLIGPGEDVRKASWRVRMVEKERRETRLEDYKRQIRRILASVPYATTNVADPPIIEGIGDQPPIRMQIVGREFPVLRREAEHLADVLRSIPGTVDVTIQDSPGKPELQIKVDRDAAARQGLTAGAVAQQARLAGQGEVAGQLRQGRSDADIRVRLSAEERGSAAALERLWLASPRGPIMLSQVAKPTRAEGPAMIEHEQRERQIVVTSQIAATATLGDVVQRLHEQLDGYRLPDGYRFLWRGMQKQMKEMKESLELALALALMFIYIVLASQFESFVHPLTIMLSLPLAFVGAVFGLALTGSSMSMGSNIGVIMLMGLVTKNAILLVDGALQHLRGGATPQASLLKAGPRRLRPILMTSAAMILGMLPTAIGRGMGSEFRAPMAIAVIGGVLTSTLLTLWVVPVVFLWVQQLSRGARQESRPAVAFRQRRVTSDGTEP